MINSLARSLATVAVTMTNCIPCIAFRRPFSKVMMTMMIMTMMVNVAAASAERHTLRPTPPTLNPYREP